VTNAYDEKNCTKTQKHKKTHSNTEIEDAIAVELSNY